MPGTVEQSESRGLEAKTQHLVQSGPRNVTLSENVEKIPAGGTRPFTTALIVKTPLRMGYVFYHLHDITDAS